MVKRGHSGTRSGLGLLALQVLVAEVGGDGADEDEGVQSSAHAGTARVGGRGDGRGGSLRRGVASLRWRSVC